MGVGKGTGWVPGILVCRVGGLSISGGWFDLKSGWVGCLSGWVVPPGGWVVTPPARQWSSRWAG